jgi:hypothetical protein
MIYGVQDEDLGTLPAPSYVASAVHFGGSTILWYSSFTSTDSPLFAFTGWFNVDWLTLGPTMFVFDAVSNFAPYFASNRFQVCDSGGLSYYGFNFNAVSPPLNSTGWQFVIGAIDSSTGKRKMYFDGTAGSLTNYGSSGFTTGTNGKSFFLGGDSGTNVTGDVADFSLWIGNSGFLDGSGDIPASTRLLFRDAGGHPVDPAVSVGALGTPALFLSGDHTTFLNNTLGGEGAITYNPSFNTVLTDAATHP